MTTTITPLPNSPGRPVDPPTEAHVIRRVQVHQYNDSEILEFFNRHGVEFQLVGDHLFIIRSRKNDLAAGPGDWLVAGPDLPAGTRVRVTGAENTLLRIEPI